jgi:hypothetical protein
MRLASSQRDGNSKLYDEVGRQIEADERIVATERDKDSQVNLRP